MNKLPINFYINKNCNYSCKHCFSTFKECEVMTEKEAIKIIDKISIHTDKLTFVGGEPLLCSYLPKLLKYTKEKGIMTSIITNGSLLTEKFLRDNQEYIDWIGLSIDSLDNKTNLEIGRISKGKVLDYRNIVNLIKKYGIRLKINTVVSRINHREDLKTFIEEINPLRWKVFQVLFLDGVNSDKKGKLGISSNEYKEFISRNKTKSMVSENNEAMEGSYYMIDPSGRVFDNVGGINTYSESLLGELSFKEATESLCISNEKIKDRDGHYYKDSYFEK